jgi:hypothetical protein
MLNWKNTVAGALRGYCMAASAALVACLPALHARADIIYWGQNSSVYSFDVATGATSTLITGTGTGAGGNDITAATALAVGPDGDIYVGGPNDGGYIVRVTPNGAPTTFASDGSLLTGFAFDSKGNLYASEYATNSIGEFTPTGMGSEFASGVQHPQQEAFDAPGNLYVISNETASGSTVVRITPSAGQSTFATGVAGLYFDGSGNLYTGLGSGAITLTTPSGSVSTFATGFNYPIPLGLDSLGDLYVWDAGTNGAVDRVAPGGDTTQLFSAPSVFDVVVATPEPGLLFLFPVVAALAIRRHRRSHYQCGITPNQNGVRQRRESTLAFEQLDRRVLLSAVISSSPAAYTAISAGTITVPWQQDLSSSGNTGDEQIVAEVKGAGVTEVLATSIYFDDWADYGQGLGDTSLRLYSKADGSSTWYEQDINAAFDGQLDTGLLGGALRNFARKDNGMGMDADGNLYIEYSSDASALAVDRIPESMVQELANGEAISPYSSTQILDPSDVAAIGSGALRPQMAVGSVGSTGLTAVYVFTGDITDPSGTPYAGEGMWSWEGGVGDTFARVSGSAWTFTADSGDPATGVPPGGVAGAFAPMTVDGNGDLYALDAHQQAVYEFSWADASDGFTRLFGLGAGGGSGLAAYTGTDGVTTLFSLSTDAASDQTVASTPVTGDDAGVWQSSAPFSPVVNSLGPQLAIDPVSGQASVLYQNPITGGLDIAVANGDGWAIAPVVAGPLTLAVATDIDKQDPYSVYDGSAAVVWAQYDSTVTESSGLIGTTEDVTELPVQIGSATGETLTVTDSTASDQVAVSRGASADEPTINVNGTAQSYDASSPVVNVVVDAEDGASLTVDLSDGNPVPLGDISFNGVSGDGSVLTISGPEGDGASGTYTSHAVFDAGQINFNDLVLDASGVSAVSVDEGDGGDANSEFGILPYALTLDEGDGANTVDVNVSGLDSTDLESWTPISLGGDQATTTLSLTGTGGEDTVGVYATDVALDGTTPLVEYSGLGNLAYGNADTSTVAIYSTAAPDVAFSSTVLAEIEVAGLSSLPTVADNGAYQFDAGSYSVQDPGGSTFGFSVIVDDGASVTFLGGDDYPSVPYLTVNGGTAVFEPYSGAPYTVSHLLCEGDSTISVSGEVDITNGTVESGGTTFEGSGEWSVGTLAADDSGVATLAPGSTFGVQSLSIADGSSMVLSAHGSGAASQLAVGSLSISPGGLLDLGDNGMIVDYGTGTDPVALIRGYLVAGYNGGAWNGYGIQSSVAAYQAIANPATYALGYADGADGVVSWLHTGEIAVVYTVYGDATLSGSAEFNDLNIVITDYRAGGDTYTWDQGDFNYDGIVDINDLDLLLSNL